uniref:Uncharacterized protein n=1 Tax=Tetraselmis sp. GSL018 TaxID=582737 RepID=A0A061RC83_9CHLO
MFFGFVCKDALAFSLPPFPCLHLLINKTILLVFQAVKFTGPGTNYLPTLPTLWTKSFSKSVKTRIRTFSVQLDRTTVSASLLTGIPHCRRCQFQL